MANGVTNDLQKIIDNRDPDRVITVIEPEPGKESQVRTTLENRGIDFESFTVGSKTMFEATLPVGTVQSLSTSRGILSIDHQPTFQPLGAAAPGITVQSAAENVNRLDLQTALEHLNVPAAWDALDTRGDGVRVGVVDTPVDSTHPAIEDAIDESRDRSGQDHGTWVAGAIAAAETETDDGTVQGVAPDAELVTAGALTRGGASVREIAEGVNYCLERDVDIINMSFGGQHSSAMHTVVQEVRDQGVLPVVAAGNSGPAPDSLTCPGHHEEALCVAAVTNDDRTSRFSSRGPGWEGIDKPDVTAPGGNSRFDDGTEVTEAILGPVAGSEYRFLLGTSMATPLVAGIAALRASANND